MKNRQIINLLWILGAVGLGSCDNTENENPSLRTSISYNDINDDIPYDSLFVDASGESTVDVADGSDRHKMFQALNYYSTSSISSNAHIDANQLKNLFSNTGNPFADISTATITISGEELNSSSVNLRDVVASSLSSTDAEAVREQVETWFEQIEEASHALENQTVATEGQAGKLDNYLVDARGVELAQVIQKALIGALQLDYIGNVLLKDGLNADNHELVANKNYTALEHNWDVAYGLFTLKSRYLEAATEQRSNEFGAGSYVWEYNKANYANIHPAFLKGRAAIVNNDRAELETQANFIRTQIELAIANAALGYLEKWKTAQTDAARAHAFGEGLGFIYSLRFAEQHDADAAFSESVLEGLNSLEGGFWDLEVTHINAAADAIKTKFGIQ